MLQICDLFTSFSGKSSDVLAFKGSDFASDFLIWIEINIIVVDISTQILLTVLLFIDQSSRCKLNIHI